MCGVICTTKHVQTCLQLPFSITESITGFRIEGSKDARIALFLLPNLESKFYRLKLTGSKHLDTKKPTLGGLPNAVCRPH